MKKRTLIWVPALLLLAALGSCTAPERESHTPDAAGLWDFAFFQQNPNLTTYLVEVTVSGGSGSARVQVLSDRGDNSGPSQVNALVPIPLGACGLNVIFADTLGGPLNLVNGDQWSISVANGSVSLIEPNPDNTSLARVSASGTYTCLVPPCSSGMYQSGEPLPWDIAQAFGTEEFSLDQVEITQSDANFTATIAEQKTLSLFLVGLHQGDSVLLCYQRLIKSDEQAGSFFRVRLVNSNRYEQVESLVAPNMTSAAQNTCYRFQAQAVDARVDFIMSLAGLNDAVWIDSIVATVNGASLFSDDFESGNLQNDLAPTGFRWQLRAPANMTGQAGVSTVSPLAGTYSFRAAGGRTKNLSGSILAGSGDMLTSLLGGLGGVNAEGVSFSINDGFKEGYYGSFGGAFQENSSLLGTFSGQEGVCWEKGQFLVGINPSEFYPLSGLWSMTLEGQAQNCDTITGFSKVFVPFIPLQKADRFYSDPSYPVLDDFLNSYQLYGRVLGSGVYFTMEDYAARDYRNALFYGIISATVPAGTSVQLGNTTVIVGDTTLQVGNTVEPRPDIVGTFNGWLQFDKGWKCQSSGTFRVYSP